MMGISSLPIQNNLTEETSAKTRNCSFFFQNLNFFCILPKYLNGQGPLHSGPHVFPSILSYYYATCLLSFSFFPKVASRFMPPCRHILCLLLKMPELHSSSETFLLFFFDLAQILPLGSLPRLRYPDPCQT